MQLSTRSSEQSAADATTVHDVIVIGAGFGGIGAVIKLRAKGIDDVIVLEKSAALGGTWRDNTYPGCACDVPSPLYSYSFAPNPEWSRFYAGDAEILAYLQRVAADYDVVDRIRFDTTVLAAHWCDEERHWRVETTAETYLARMVVTGTGSLSEPSVPPIPGVDRFVGKIFHSARWDHEHDLTNRRVAVIGTGASAVQFVPEIQPRVERLVVVQRTAQWVLPKPDKSVGDRERQIYRRFPALQRAVRALVHLSFEAVTAGTRRPWLLRPMEGIGRRHLRRGVADPDLRRRLTPRFSLGCKRILLSNRWYGALGGANVDVVSGGVREFTESGFIDEHGSHHEVDTIILATGFHAAEPPVAALFFDGSSVSMKDHFRDRGAEAYLGTTVAGFPNLFLLTGPNTFVYGSIVGVIEAQLNYICDAIDAARRHRLTRIEVRHTVQAAYNDVVQSALSSTVWNTGCTSYFLDKSGRNTTMWPWSQAEMFRRMQRFNADDYFLQRDALPAENIESVNAR